ncbi:hypothetical protein CEXT_482871 [Caerostris extrusa]|uniref:Uncharacterized protein n=1 Tax=Caerostris extrusa TaxID=172846 RepID=A0AAV4RXK4_CAEEX|nr:hypothetical protein CEXT_482871 [Caerostris extrusa]
MDQYKKYMLKHLYNISFVVFPTSIKCTTTVKCPKELREKRDPKELKHLYNISRCFEQQGHLIKQGVALDKIMVTILMVKGKEADIHNHRFNHGPTNTRSSMLKHFCITFPLSSFLPPSSVPRQWSNRKELGEKGLLFFGQRGHFGVQVVFASTLRGERRQALIFFALLCEV